MGNQTKGRGVAAAFGLLLLFAGVIGAAVLFVSSNRREGDAVKSFARAPVGCTTTLEFTETGTFFVFEETDGALDVPSGDCQPTAEAGRAFSVQVTGPSGEIDTRRDDSLDYQAAGFAGLSVSRVTIDQPGEYQVVVVGDAVGTVAAIGRDPSDGVRQLRLGALAAGVGGVVLGVLLLLISGRRSKRSSATTSTNSPGIWPPEPPSVSQVQPPPSPASPSPAFPQPAPPSEPGNSPWAPPSIGGA